MAQSDNGAYLRYAAGLLNHDNQFREPQVRSLLTFAEKRSLAGCLIGMTIKYDI